VHCAVKPIPRHASGQPLARHGLGIGPAPTAILVGAGHEFAVSHATPLARGARHGLRLPARMKRSGP